MPNTINWPQRGWSHRYLCIKLFGCGLKLSIIQKIDVGVLFLTQPKINFSFGTEFGTKF